MAGRPLAAARGLGGNRLDPGLIQIVWIAFLFIVFYLLIIRPQQTKMKKRQQLISELRVGDRVETVGGIQGVIMSLDSESLELQIAPEVTVTLMRRAVAGRVGSEE